MCSIFTPESFATNFGWIGGKFYHSTKTYSLKALAYATYYSEIAGFNFKTGVARRWVVVEVDFQTKIGLP